MTAGAAQAMAKSAPPKRRLSRQALSLPNLLFYLPAIVGVALLALVAVHRLLAPREAAGGGPGAHGV